MPAYNTASKNAKRNNAAYCRIFSSTPGDLDTNAGEQANQVLSTTYKWTEKFYDIGPEAAREIIRRNSASRIVYIEYTYQQLGKDEEWFYFFTGEEESRRKQCGNVIMSIPLYDMMEIAYKSDKVQGLVINPFGKYVRLTKELLGFILKEFKENWQED